MNMHIDPDTFAKIQAQLEQERGNAPTNKIDQAFESAGDIRSSLVSVKGERYARLVEIGVTIHKQMSIAAFTCKALADSGEMDSAATQQILDIAAKMYAQMLNHACVLYKEDHNMEFAHELTGWVDRVLNAEEVAAKTITKELFKGEDE